MGLSSAPGSMLTPLRGPLSTVRSISSMASSLLEAFRPAVPTKRPGKSPSSLMMSSLEIVPLKCPLRPGMTPMVTPAVSISCNMSSGDFWATEGACFMEKHSVSLAVRSTLSYTPMFRKPRAGGRIRKSMIICLTPLCIAEVDMYKNKCWAYFLLPGPMDGDIVTRYAVWFSSFYRTDRGRLSVFIL